MLDNIASHRRNAILSMCFFRDNMQFYTVRKKHFRHTPEFAEAFTSRRALRDLAMIRADMTSYRLYSA